MGTNLTVAKNTSLIRKLFNFPKRRQDLRHPRGNQRLQLIPQTLQTRQAVGSLVSRFHVRPLPHMWSQKMWTAILVAELPSYFAFAIKLCLPSTNSLWEHVVWLSITKLWWHFKSKEQILNASEYVCYEPKDPVRDTFCQQLNPPGHGGGHEHQWEPIQLDRLSINR